MDVRLLKAYGLLRVAFAVLLLHTITEAHVLINPLFYPQGFYAPASLAHWLIHRPDASALGGVALLAVASTVCLGLGLFTRWAGPVAWVSSTMLLSLSYSFGRMNHNTHSLPLYLLIFMFSDWGAFYSLDSLFRGKKLPRVHHDWHPQYMLLIFLATLSVPYFCSGLFKMLKGHFWQPGYINSIIVSKQILWAEFAPIPAFCLWLKQLFLQWPLLGLGLAWLTLLVEVGFALCLSSPGARVVILAVVVAFHAGITLTTKILFFEHMVLMALIWLVSLYLYLRKPAPHVALPDAPTWRVPLGVLLLALPGVPWLAEMLQGSGWLSPSQWTSIARVLHSPFPMDANYFDTHADLWMAGGLLVLTSLVLAGFGFKLVRQWLGLAKGFRSAVNPVFIYDGDCGFCQQSVQVLQAWGAQATFQSNYDSTALMSAAGLTLPDSQRYALWLEQHPQTGEWLVERGAGAVNAALSRCPGVWPGLPLRLASSLYPLAGIKQVQNLVYRWVANNRYWISQGTCKLPGSPSGLSG
jgi:predicted DCC family thiol-disulfide oxidoreductase YuxK